jgi:hypothetical protein
MAVTFVFSQPLSPGLSAPASTDYFLNTEKSWVLQSYLELKDHAPVLLSDSIPEYGPFVMCAYTAPPGFIPSPKQLFISVSADGPPHLGADIHIVQNRRQAALLPNAVFVPHWPQPGLLARDVTRGDKFENVAYIGDTTNLDPALATPEWTAALADAGLNWIVPQASGRDPADMRDIDAVVAIRSFKKTGFIRKPASKLVNALLANTPAICGRELAFREICAPGTGYLEARSSSELFLHLRSLQASPEMRGRLVRNGRIAVAAYTRDAVRQAWLQLTDLQHIGKLMSRKTRFPKSRAALRRIALAAQHKFLTSLNAEDYAL